MSAVNGPLVSLILTIDSGSCGGATGGVLDNRTDHAMWLPLSDKEQL